MCGPLHMSKLMTKFCILIGLLLGSTCVSVAQQPTRALIPLKLDPTLPATNSISLADFSVSEPSIDAIRAQLPAEDLALVTPVQDATAALLSGTILAENGQLNAALALQSTALQTYPDNQELRLLRLKTALHAGNATLAFVDAIQLSNAQTDNPLVYITTLIGLARNERWEEINRLEPIDLNDPLFNFISQAVWTLATLDFGPSEEALSRVNQAFAISGFDGRQQYLTGLAALQLGSPTDALPDLVYATNNITLSQDRAALWTYRAARLANDQAITDELLSAIRRNAERNYSWLYISQSEMSQSVAPPTKRELIVEMLSELAWFFVDLANQERTDRYQTAQLLGNLAFMVDGGDTRSSVQLATLRLSIATADKADDLALFLADTIPTNDLPGQLLQLEERLAILMSLGLEEEALTSLNNLEETFLTTQTAVPARVFALYGKVYQQAQRYEDAVDAFKNWEAQHEAGSLIVADWLSYFEWAASHYWLDQPELMEEKILQALDLNPGNAFANNFLAYTWVDQNRRLEEGLQMLLAANERQPNKSSITDSVGWAYYRLGDFETALSYLEEAWAIQSDSWEIAYHLGDTYQALERINEAKWFWRRALSFQDIPANRADIILAKLTSEQ